MICFNKGFGWINKIRVGGGALIPPLLSSIRQYITGVATGGETLVDKLTIVTPVPDVGGVNCLQFDGVNGTAESYLLSQPITLGDEFEIELYAYFDSTGQNYSALFGNKSTSVAEGVVILERNVGNTGATLILYPVDGSRNVLNISGDVFNNDWHRIKLTYDNGSWYTSNDVSIGSSGSITHASGFTALDPFAVLSLVGGSSAGKGKCSEFRISVNGVDIIHHTCSEGSGLPLDASGNGNHATINTAQWVRNLDYVMSDGVDDYVDTGVTLTDSDDFVIEHVFMNMSLGDTVLGISTTDHRMMAYRGSGDTEFFFYTGGLSVTLTDTSSGYNASGMTTLVITKSGNSASMSINGVSSSALDTTAQTFDDNIFLFAGDSGASAAYHSAHDCYSHKVTLNGTLVRDMVPRPDGKFYDKVNNTIYSNDGTGTLVTTEAGSIPCANGEFGCSKALNFNGTTSYAIATNQDVAYLGSGTNFDFSIRLSGETIVNGDRPASHGTINVEGWYLSYNSVTKKLSFIPSISGAFSVYEETTANLDDGNMHTYRYVCTSGNLALYVDGVANGAWPSIRVMTVPSVHKLQLGARGTTVGLMTGDIESFVAVGGVEWYAHSAHGDEIPDCSGGGNSAIMTDVDIKYIPALPFPSKSVATFDGVADIVETGVSADGNTRLTLDAEITTLVASGIDIIAGAGDSTGGTARFYFGTYNGNWYVRYGDKGTLSGGTADTDRHTFVLDNTGLYVDGSLITNFDGYVMDAITDAISLGSVLAYNSECKIYSSLIEQSDISVCSYDFQVLGKATETIPDTVGSNDGTVTVGAGGLDSFWAKRYEDSAGVYVDAQYNLVTNDRGLVHNNHEGYNIQSPTATELLDKITVTVDGVDYVLPYTEDVEGKAKYYDATYGEVYALADGTWISNGPWSGIETNTATGLYPSKTGWTDVNGSTISISYVTPYIDDYGYLKKMYMEDYLAHSNGMKDCLIQFVEMAGGGCGVAEVLQYNQGTLGAMTIIEYQRAVNYAGTDCGAGMKVPLYNINSELIKDLNGELIFAIQE